MEEYEDNDISFSNSQPSSMNNNSPTPTPPCKHFSGSCWQKKWVRALVVQPILVTKTDQSSLKVDTSLEATATGCSLQVKALIDSGAKFQFLNINFIHDNAILTIDLPQSIPVYNVDGTEN